MCIAHPTFSSVPLSLSLKAGTRLHGRRDSQARGPLTLLDPLPLAMGWAPIYRMLKSAIFVKIPIFLEKKLNRPKRGALQAPSGASEARCMGPILGHVCYDSGKVF